MRKLGITAFDLAKRFIGVKEVKGLVDNPQIMTMLKLDDEWPQHDEVPWCFDATVEILTESGFIPLPLITLEQKVAQVDPLTMNISFTYPISTIKNEFSGKVASFNSRDFKFDCDAEHRFYGIWNKSNYKHPNELRPIKDITSHLVINAVETNKKQDNIMYTDRDLKLLAAFLSDGFNRGYFWDIQVSKERKIDFLNAINPDSTYTAKQCYGKSKNVLTTFSFKRPDIFNDIWDDYKNPSIKFLCSLSKRQIELFLDSFVVFDGHIKGSSYQLYSSNVKLRDWLQIAVTLAGFHSSYRVSSVSKYSNKPCFEVVFTKNKKHRHIRRSDIQFTNKNITLYCVEVPSGLIIIRNIKGTVIVTGNCSAFANYICWLLKLPRSHSLAAISWETVGRRITIEEAVIGFDLVVIKRGTGTQRHVTFFGGIVGERFIGLGGNQDNQVKISTYAISDITAVIRVYGDEDADDNKDT